MNIRYKAWDETLNIMCNVAAINFYFGNIVLLADNEEQRKLFQKLNKEVLIECNDRLTVPIDEVDLIQYTGLHDCKVEGIYQGDILKIASSKYVYVVWCTDGYWCACENGIDLGLLSEYNGGNYTVVGNIYQNKELLKEG